MRPWQSAVVAVFATCCLAGAGWLAFRSQLPSVEHLVRWAPGGNSTAVAAEPRTPDLPSVGTTTQARAPEAVTQQQHASDTQEQDGPACVGEVFSAHRMAQVKLKGYDGEAWLGSPQSCLELTHRALPLDDPQLLSQWKPHSRAMPPLHPQLANHNWQGKAVRPDPWPGNAPGMIRLKIYKGVLYHAFPPPPPPVPSSDPPEGNFWAVVRDAVYEMLLSVLFLYKDVPDMDLLLNPIDFPVGWQHATLPTIQPSILNTTSLIDGSEIDAEPDLYACNNNSVVAEGCPGHARGFAIPNYEAWMHLALPPGHLRWYSYCLHRRYLHSSGQAGKQCNITRRPVVFWRGSTSGKTRGWSRGRAAAHHHKLTTAGAAGCMTYAMLNKRVALAIIADKYPWMDCGITGMPFDDTESRAWPDRQSCSFLEHYVKGDFCPLEAWPSNHLCLAVNGYGYSFRASKVLLGTTPMVKVDSIIREWYAHQFRPGLHYEAVQNDLSDVAVRTRQLVEEARTDVRRLERMAARALEQGVQTFNALAMIEATAWALARIKEACPWTVRPPAGAVGVTLPEGTETEAGWAVVQLGRFNNRPYSGAFWRLGDTYRNPIVEALPHQFF